MFVGLPVKFFSQLPELLCDAVLKSREFYQQFYNITLGIRSTFTQNFSQAQPPPAVSYIGYYSRNVINC